MRKLGLLLGLVVVVIACSSAGDMMNEILDSGVPDADAQVGECPCEAGQPGEQGAPGEQGLPGEQGPPGERGPSGTASASSFVPENDLTATSASWVCEFGAAQLTVDAGQRLLITGQGTAVFAGTGSGFGEVSLTVAWREAGQSAGELGHSVTHWVDFVLNRRALHVTELTPALAAGVYELGICTRKGRPDWDSVTVVEPYGTALVINTGS